MPCRSGNCRLPGILALLLFHGVLPAADVAPPTGSTDVLIDGERLEEVWNAGEFTEGVAVARDGTIYFSDIPRGDDAGRILKFNPSTGETTVHSRDSRKSNGLMFNAEGRLFATCGANGGARALCEILPDGSVHPLVDRFEGKSLNSPNDLIIHPDGSIDFSDPRYVGPEPVELDHMSVYRFDPKTKTVMRLITGVTKPNGVELSPDGRTLYVAENDNGSTDVTRPAPPDAKPRMTLNAYPLSADGIPGPRRILVDFGKELGIDGLTVDAEGRLYCAVRSDSRFGIRVYDPEGREIASLPTPSLPTNCCFGIGPEQSRLYITAGGGLYRIRTAAKGYHPFFASPKS